MNLDKVIAVRNTKTVYRDGDKCIKVFNEDYSKADVLNEALNQARIEETGIRIPKILEVLTIDGKWAIVSEFVEGKTLSQLMKENPEKTDEYLGLLVELQLEIQSHRMTVLTKLKDKMHRKIQEADIDATAQYDLHTRLEGMPKHNKICHGDFCPSNVIIMPDGKPCVIDWAHVTQGNAGADAARSYLVFCLNWSEETADKYLELFCEKSGIEKKYIQKWMPIVAASQSCKNHPEEREFLMSWVNVVEYE